MEHIAALLLIIGCSDGLSQCNELPVPVPVYEAAEDCDNDLPAAASAYIGQYDQLFARCVPVDPALEEVDAELTWDVRPDGTLDASVQIVASDVMVASNLRSKGRENQRQE